MLQSAITQQGAQAAQGAMQQGMQDQAMQNQQQMQEEALRSREANAQLAANTQITNQQMIQQGWDEQRKHLQQENELNRQAQAKAHEQNMTLRRNMQQAQLELARSDREGRRQAFEAQAKLSKEVRDHDRRMMKAGLREKEVNKQIDLEQTDMLDTVHSTRISAEKNEQIGTDWAELSAAQITKALSDEGLLLQDAGLGLSELDGSVGDIASDTLMSPSFGHPAAMFAAKLFGKLGMAAADGIGSHLQSKATTDSLKYEENEQLGGQVIDVVSESLLSGLGEVLPIKNPGAIQGTLRNMLRDLTGMTDLNATSPMDDQQVQVSAEKVMGYIQELEAQGVNSGTVASLFEGLGRITSAQADELEFAQDSEDAQNTYGGRNDRTRMRREIQIEVYEQLARTANMVTALSEGRIMRASTHAETELVLQRAVKGGWSPDRLEDEFKEDGSLSSSELEILAQVERLEQLGLDRDQILEQALADTQDQTDINARIHDEGGRAVLDAGDAGLDKALELAQG